MADVAALAHPAVPDVGALPGKMTLNAPAPPGVVRPFNSGEYLQNPNGSWSNEMATTVVSPALNNGKPTNVPTLWIINGRPTRVTDDQAAALAAKSGLVFPSYPTPEAADQAATARENQWQSIEPQNSGSVPTIWSRPKPAPTGGGLLKPNP